MGLAIMGQAAHSLRVGGGEGGADGAAEAVADEVDAADAQGVQEAEPVREHVLDRELVAEGRRLRSPEAAAVQAHHAVLPGQQRHPLVVEAQVAVAVVVEEDDLRRAPGVGEVVVLVVEVVAVDVYGGHRKLLSTTGPFLV
jgi:predicted flap endonuclease-1-like 5' DNA nuclease